jgi:phage gp29-like protein
MKKRIKNSAQGPTDPVQAAGLMMGNVGLPIGLDPANAAEARKYGAFWRPGEAGPAGMGSTPEELVRRSNFWRDNYNPLRSLTIGRLMMLFEQAERGAFAEIQLTLRKSEKRFPVLKGFTEKLLSAIESLDGKVRVKEQLPEGATAAMAEKQRKFLQARYDLLKNFKTSLAQIALADLRGYAVLQKHRYKGGVNDGAVEELYWLEPWCMVRDGFYGDFYYNENSQFGVGLGSCQAILGEDNRVGSEALPREDFVIRETESPLYEIALIAFVTWLMGRKDYSAFVEIFGLPNAIVILPPGIQPGKESEYQSSAERVARGSSGCLPNGSDAKFPSQGVRGGSPFEKFCDAQERDFVLAATGGVLTMLSAPTGIGKGASEEHDGAWQKIAVTKAVRINDALQRDFDGPELAEAFPDQPVCVEFSLSIKDEEDVGALLDNVVKAEGVGLQVDADEISELSGLKLTRVEQPAPAAPGEGGNPEDPIAGAAAKLDQRQDKHEINAALRNRSLRTASILNHAADGDPSPDELAETLHEMLLPLLKRLEAIAQVDDAAIQQHMLEKLLKDFPQIAAAMQADNSLAKKLSPALAESLLAGLTAKPMIGTDAESAKNRELSRLLNTDFDESKHPRNPAGSETGGRFAGAEDLAAFHDESIKPGADNKHAVKRYRDIDETEAASIQAGTRTEGNEGINVRGYTHAVDNYALRHIHIEHGDPATELPRGQLPVTREDIARLPEITAKADKIEHAGKTELGRDGIRYTKQYEGKTVVVEEVRTKRKLLVPVSIKKFKNRATIDAKAPISTSKTLRPNQ